MTAEPVTDARGDAVPAIDLTTDGAVTAAA